MYLFFIYLGRWTKTLLFFFKFGGLGDFLTFLKFKLKLEKLRSKNFQK